jgi:hypothetical protein
MPDVLSLDGKIVEGAYPYTTAWPGSWDLLVGSIDAE